MSLPDQLLLSDLLSRRVRCDRGLEHGTGQLGWMHPPVHRLLGWVSRPSPLSSRRCVWRLDQLRELGETEVRVEGDPADTDAATLERLPTLLGATLLSSRREPLGQLADAAFERRSGRILHYLVARSDPRLPGGSRWRLTPDRIVDQRAGEVATALESLGDLPLARASLRETLLRRSRRLRDQWDEETGRLRDQWQQASGRFEDRLEGWLEEPPWQEPRSERPVANLDEEVWPEDEPAWREDRELREAGRATAAESRFDVSAQAWPSEPEPSARPSGRWRDAWSEDNPDPAEEDVWPAQRPSGGGSVSGDTRRRPPLPEEEDDPWV